MATQPFTDPLTLTVGVLIPEADGFTFDHLLTADSTADTITPSPPPAGLTFSKPYNSGGPPWNLIGRLSGTPSTVGVHTVSVRGTFSELEQGTPNTGALTINVVEPGPEPVTAAPPVFDDVALTVTIPESIGVAYSLNGTPVPAGTTESGAGLTVTVTAAPLDAGYVLEGDTEWSHTFPGEPPEDWSALLTEDPEALTVRAALAPRVVKHTAALEDSDATELASAHVGVVLEYVRGYTRGRGFHGMIPERDLQAVIVAAAARLFTNPEQVASFTMGDYSERPAILAGWTMAEMGVLRRHRVIWR